MLSSGRPKRERISAGNGCEVFVCGKHRQVVADAQGRQQGVDGRHLQAFAPASVSQVGRLDVVVAPGNQEREGGEAVDYLVTQSRSGKALEEFLQNQSGREDRLARSQSPSEFNDAGIVFLAVPSERQGPHAGVDEEAQSRERAFL